MGGYDELTPQQRDMVKMLHEILCAQFGGAFPSGTAARILPSAVDALVFFATLLVQSAWGGGGERAAGSGC